ncbi:MAG: class I SAM-dependent methyltransferase [Nitrospira sp.]|nr:class I SAM-dependent methyltransferase [Nitrospira sp.]
MERRAAYPTDTQHVVNLSGYVWAARQIDAARPHRILDLSCGTGYGADYLGPCADTIVAIDCVQAVVAKSRSDYPRPNVHFLAMDGCALGFRDESFDCIVSQDTIEHIPDDGRFVAELTRVLRLRGTLIIFTPHGKGKGDQAKRSLPYSRIHSTRIQGFAEAPLFHDSLVRTSFKATGSRRQNSRWTRSAHGTRSDYVPVFHVRFVIGSAV